MNSNIIELSPSEVGTLFTFINKTLDAHELTQGFKYGGLTGMKGIYDGLLRCKILTDANPSLYTQSKYLSPDFGAGILTKQKLLKTVYDSVSFWPHMKDHSVDLFYSATHKESGRKVTLKLIHLFGQCGVRFNVMGRKQPGLNQIKAYKLLFELLQERFPNVQLISQYWEISCNKEPLFFLIEFPQHSDSLTSILKRQTNPQPIVRIYLQIVSRDMMAILFKLHQNCLSLLTIKSQTIFYYEQFGFIPIDLVVHSMLVKDFQNQQAALQKSHSLTLDSKESKEKTSNYFEESLLNFKDVPQLQINMMPAEVMLSKLNERMTFNPFKVDIYNFGLVLLELAGNEVKPQMDEWSQKTFQIYDKVLDF